jgi:hypothetical protein
MKYISCNRQLRWNSRKASHCKDLLVRGAEKQAHKEHYLKNFQIVFRIGAFTTSGDFAEVTNLNNF